MSPDTCISASLGYSKYESGANDLPTDVLIQLSNLYNTSIDYLLGQTDNPNRYE